MTALLVPRKLTEEEIEYIASAVPSKWPVPESDTKRVKALRDRIGVKSARLILDAQEKAVKSKTTQSIRGIPNMTDKDPVRFIEFRPTAFDETVETALAELKEHVETQTRALTLAPVLIDVARETMIRRYDKAKAESGDAVGVRAAEALGGPLQQMALNSFHASGTARNVAGGVGVLNELINLSATRANPSCTVHFVQPLGFVDAIRKEAELVGVTVGSLTKDVPLIFGTSSFTPDWWYPVYTAMFGVTAPTDADWVCRIKLDTELLLNHRISIRDVTRAIEFNSTVRCIASPSHIGIIDIYPSKTELAAALAADAKKAKKAKKIAADTEEAEGAEDEGEDEAPDDEIEDETEEDRVEREAMEMMAVDEKKRKTTKVMERVGGRNVVKEIITEETGIVDGNPVNEIVARRRTTHDTTAAMPLVGDLRPGERVMNDVSIGLGPGFAELMGNEKAEYATLMFLNAHIIPALDKMEVKGIPGITEIYPVLKPVWSVVDKEVGNKGLWKVSFNVRRLRVSGITTEEIKRLIELVPGLDIVRIDASGASILNTRKPNQRPGEAINEAVSLQRDAYDKALDALQSKDRGNIQMGHTLPREKFPILDAASHIAIDTVGTNLRELLMRRDVDPTRTYSNNVHEIAAIFGIGAARVFLMTEFNRAIEASGSYAQARHLMTLVDFMTTRGVPLSVSFSALGKRNTHTLAQATNQQSMKVFANAAAMGKKENVSGASARIMLNRPGQYGTGVSAAYMRPEIEAQSLVRFETEVAPQIEAAAAAAATMNEAQTLEQRGPGTGFITGLPKARRERTKSVSREEIRSEMGLGATITPGVENTDAPSVPLGASDFELDDLVGETVRPVIPSAAPREETKIAPPEQASEILAVELKSAPVFNPALIGISKKNVPNAVVPEGLREPTPGEVVLPKTTTAEELGGIKQPTSRRRADAPPPGMTPAKPKKEATEVAKPSRAKRTAPVKESTVEPIEETAVAPVVRTHKTAPPAPTVEPTVAPRRKLAPLTGKIKPGNLADFLAPVNLEAVLKNPIVL